MRAQKASGTKPERTLLSLCIARGLPEPETNPRDILGKPDLVWRDSRVAVFVDGCYWHGCPTHFKLPRTRRAWWRRKVERNRIRDRGIAWACGCGRMNGLLVERGWRVVRVWEHDVYDPDAASGVVDAIEALVNADVP